MMEKNKDGTITLTPDQFKNAVMKANNNWMSTIQKLETTDAMTIAITGTQNMMFALELTKVLFEESEDKE